MAAKIIDGKAIAAQVREELVKELEELTDTASKGGYIARFTESDGIKVTADGDWLVP